MALLKIQGVPNLITWARLAAVPVLVWLMLADRMAEAFWLFVVAGASDAVDGYLAKRFNAESVFGSYLDPFTDKIMLISVYLLLARAEALPIWLVILIIVRDAALLAGSFMLFFANRRIAMRPMIISKINTGLQIVLAGYVLAWLGLEFTDHGVTDVLVFAVAAATFLSGAAYTYRLLTGHGRGKNGGGAEGAA
ncbi:MAG: CDP-alcohol phosphatidyltransferase family protein [Alphaproteobacteria bacterium]